MNDRPFFLAPHRYFQRKTGHLRTCRPFFFAHHLMGGKLDVCRRDDLFCSSLDFGRKIRIVFICVGLCGVRNNKLLNLGVRDLKKVENHWINTSRQAVAYNKSGAHLKKCSPYATGNHSYSLQHAAPNNVLPEASVSLSPLPKHASACSSIPV